ncbi:hypothetical protein TCAL_16646 [Tigriopus californicus]|uniref:Uncharacterized protein n=1 Tax=Tigriopus californicus TaxID=6832 RepID=A0A553NDI6_TIGCA|nr:uncharacterized protein LOC131889682 isoform X1 [Tigriopus californicus]TRY63516.1 hypothetical protein TCAL_16646 [Tigriopus californicus]
MEVLTPLCSPMNLRPGPVFDFTLTRTPEEMALYDRFGEAYQQRVETFSPCSQLHLKRLIAYEVPNHPRVMFRNHGDVEGLMACSEVDLPPTPGISSQIATPKSPGRITPRSLKPSENSRLLSSPQVPPAWGKGSSKKAGTIPPNVLLNVKPMAMLSAIKNRKVVKKLRFDTGANQIRKISKSYSDCLEQLGCPDPTFQPTLPQQPLSSSKLTSHSYRRVRKVRRISKSLADLSRFSDNTIMSVTDSNNNNSANYDNHQSRHDGPPDDGPPDDAGPAKDRGMIKRSMRSRIPRLKPNFMEGLKKIAVDDRNH